MKLRTCKLSCCINLSFINLARSVFNNHVQSHVMAVKTLCSGNLWRLIDLKSAQPLTS